MYNFWKAGPLIFGRAKYVQNSARFLTTFAFDREYLRNHYRYTNNNNNNNNLIYTAPACRMTSERNVIDSDSSRVPRKMPGELWSTNQKVLLANIEPHKWIFRGRLYISALRGCWALKILHALENDQGYLGYLAHTPTGTGVPPKKKLIVKIKNRASNSAY